MVRARSQFLKGIEKKKQESNNREELSKKGKAMRAKYGKDYDIYSNKRVSIKRLEGRTKDSAKKKNNVAFLILDRDLDSVCFQDEHKIVPYGDFTKTYYRTCIAETDECPLCKAANRSHKNVKPAISSMGFTVIPLSWRMESGKIKYSLKEDYVDKKTGKKVYSKLFWQVTDVNTIVDLDNYLSDFADSNKGSIRGAVIPVKWGEGTMDHGHGYLTDFGVSGGQTKVYDKKDEKFIKAVGNKICPAPLKTKEGQVITSELVKTHDANWAVSPLNCYEAIQSMYTAQELIRDFDPDYVAEIDPDDDVDLEDELESVSDADLEGLDEGLEEVDEDEDLADEDLEEEIEETPVAKKTTKKVAKKAPAKKPTAKKATGSRRTKTKVTKPEIVEEDDSLEDDSLEDDSLEDEELDSLELTDEDLDLDELELPE